MKKTIILMTVLVLTALAGFAQDKPASPDPVVIAAGDIAIRQSEFETALKTLPAEYQQYFSGPGKKQFAEDFLRMKMLAAAGTKAGLDKDPEVIAQLKLMRENLVANAQLQKIEKGIAISEADLKKAYDASKKDYEQVSARHILIAFKGSPAAQAGKPELTEEQAKAKAEDLRKKIVAGAKFEELAQAESDDIGSGSRGGDLGAFGRGQMVPEFESAAFNAKAGEVTDVVRTQFGYHIIKVDSHDTESFESVKANLEKAERQKKLQAELDAMKTNAKATFNETYFTPPADPAAPPPTAAPATGDKKP